MNYEYNEATGFYSNVFYGSESNDVTVTISNNESGETVTYNTKPIEMHVTYDDGTKESFNVMTF